MQPVKTTSNSMLGISAITWSVISLLNVKESLHGVWKSVMWLPAVKVGLLGRYYTISLLIDSPERYILIFRSENAMAQNCQFSSGVELKIISKPCFTNFSSLVEVIFSSFRNSRFLSRCFSLQSAKSLSEIQFEFTRFVTGCLDLITCFEFSSFWHFFLFITWHSIVFDIPLPFLSRANTFPLTLQIFVGKCLETSFL